MFGKNIMSRQRWRAGGVVLGLLLLADPGRADEATAIEAIKKLGGRVEVDAKRPGQPVVGVDLDNTKVTDAGLKELKEVKSLQTLYLSVTAVTDAGLKELKELKNLQTLYLNGTKVTDRGLKELKDLKNLRTLEVAFTAVTDAGVKELKAALPKIDISH